MSQIYKLINDVIKIDCLDHDVVGSPDIVFEVNSIKRELSEIYLTRVNEAILRSRANWSLLGEQPASYFLALEKRCAKEKTISALKDKDGKIVTSNKDILATQKEFFENMYREDPTSLSSLDDLPLSPEDVPQISEQKKQLLKLPFTHREILAALKDLGSNKCPGSEGLTREFYLSFWTHLQLQPYYDSLLYSSQTGFLSEEQEKCGKISFSHWDKLYVCYTNKNHRLD